MKEKLSKQIEVSSGAIIMAMGIFLLGAIHQFPLIEQTFKLLFGSAFILWIIMLRKFICLLFNVDYFRSIWNQPIQSFGLGTWIAATSVMIIIIHQKFPEIMGVQIVVYINCIAWLIYIIFACLQLKKIIVNRLIEDVHGVILLTTVSTQSIACLLIATFQLPIEWIILLGVLLYFVSISLIMIRFIIKVFNVQEWKNTDCIIHGALSITGLAMTLSHAFEIKTLILLWFIVLCLFIIVEIFEILRGILRIKLYGIKKALFTYHTSQWARNFTFGMFYYFTLNLIHYAEGKVNLIFQTHVMNVLGWVVLVLLIVEIVLWVIPRNK